jgi:hypothetical protein
MKAFLSYIAKSVETRLALRSHLAETTRLATLSRDDEGSPGRPGRFLI